MRILMASDNENTAQRVQRALAYNGLDCPCADVVKLELAADRASRLIPDLLLFVLPSDDSVGVELLRQTVGMVHGKVFAIGRSDDPKLILSALHNGADEYLDISSLEEDLAAALARMKAREMSAQVERRAAGRIIAVLGPSGGSGTSTLSTNIAVSYAMRHGSSGLVDLKLGAGDLSALLDVRPQHSIADLCRNLERLDRSMFEQFFSAHDSGTHLLAAPYDPNEVFAVDAKGVRQMLAMSRARFPYVLLDVGSDLGDVQIEALWQSDILLIVLRLDYISLRNARRTMDRLIALGLGTERVQFVANGCGVPKQLSIAQAEQALEMKIKYFIPNDPRRVNGAVNSGVPVVMQHPGAKVSKSLAKLADGLNGHCPL